MVLRRTDDNSITQLPAAAFYTLMKEGQITVTPSHPNDDRLRDHGPALQGERGRSWPGKPSLRDCAPAVGRHNIDMPLPRFHRVRLVAGVRCIGKPKRLYGSGYLGLLPQTHRRGNQRGQVAISVTRELMATVIHQDYETHKQKSIYASWSALQTACKNQGLIAPSYETFRQAVHARRRPFSDPEADGATSRVSAGIVLLGAGVEDAPSWRSTL